MENKSQETAQFIVDKVGDTVIEFLRNTNISKPCVSSIISLLRGFAKTKKWAVEMIDASGKLPEGILTGTVTAFGSYDECVDIKLNTEDNTGGFRGQYCTLRFQPVLPPHPRFQSIVKRLDIFTNFTSSDKYFIKRCAVLQLSFLPYWNLLAINLSSGRHPEIIRQKYKGYNLLAENITQKSCRDFSCKHADYGRRVVLLAVCLFTLVSTTIDIFLRKMKGKTELIRIVSKRTSLEYFMAFSLYTNSKKLFSTKTSARTIGALHGIRLISILWIIWGHLYFYINYQGFTDSFGATAFVSSFLAQPLMNGTVAVDTFFFLRLAPPLAFVICLTMLIPLLGSGPLWHESIDHVVEGCRKKWWTNLLFINNFLTTKDVLQQAIGWMLSATGLLLVLYGTYNWNRGVETDQTSVILYAATHRTVWALAIAWLTMTCIYGYGGFLNTFLSWKFLMVLDRVTFATYLLHPLVQQVYYSRYRVHLPDDHYVMAYIYFGTLMVVYPAAFVFTLFFESPFLAIEKLMLRRHTEKRGIEQLS
ncbi:nose resistant to fluoxetine protein 6-like [Limulus polyphemus]|uniref:Nose resistant to fluoxetine protein 6-like n=1 Tax=Limulus polyphemus TaxID=6850 RepID=A0ABM1T6R3_LIMPO|nr:nose resistant to fluoxetine protein 6-like [Limulus polyphemus]